MKLLSGTLKIVVVVAKQSYNKGTKKSCKIFFLQSDHVNQDTAMLEINMGIKL